MVNKNLLLGKIVSCGYNQVKIAQELGKSKNTINAKINGKRPFDSDEILQLCSLLKITDDKEKVAIFLAESSQFRDDSADIHHSSA